jgi:hypothetical protein
MLKVSSVARVLAPCPAPPAAFELGLSELDAGFWSRAGLAMPDLRADAMALLEIREPTEEHTKPDTSSSGINALLGLLSQHVTRHASRLVPRYHRNSACSSLG